MNKPVVVECGGCGNEFNAAKRTEYGVTWIEPEECPVCGEHDDDVLVVRDADGPS